MTQLPYNETKTTQAAALLLTWRGGRMSYMKLIKLLYLADREALLRWGRPITGDAYCALDHGPILSRTLNLINEGCEPTGESMWLAHISAPDAYDVSLLRPAGDDALSTAEVDLLQEVYGRYGQLSRWQLVALTHALPEWQDPHGSAIRIAYRDILEAGGLTDRQIAAVEDELQDVADLAAVVGSR